MPEPVKLTAAKYKLLADYPYFSSVLYNMVSIPQEGLGTTGVDKDWKLYYDPKVIDEYDTIALSAFLAHEIEHCLRGHHDRCMTREPHKFNIAGDFEINDSYDLILKHLPKKYLRLADEIGKPRGLTAEEYYEFLDKMQQNAQKNKNGQPVEGMPTPTCGGCSGNPQPWEKPGDKGENGEEGKNSFEQQLVRTQVAKDVQAHGNAPAHLQKWANEHLNPSIPWERELRAIIKNAISRAQNPTDFTYRRPQRKFVEDFVFPRTIGYQPTIGVWVDTSGSMYCGQRFEKAVAELTGLLKGRKLLIATGDTQLATFQTDITNIKKVNFTGGGGTDVEAGITQLYEKAHGKIDIMIVLTDMETSWGHRIPPVKTIIVNVGEAGVAGPTWKHKRLDVK